MSVIRSVTIGMSKKKYWHIGMSQYRNTYNPLPDGPAQKIGQHEQLTRQTSHHTTCLSMSWDNNYLNMYQITGGNECKQRFYFFTQSITADGSRHGGQLE